MSTTIPQDDLVFVYGTLRRGGSNHWRMEQCRYVCDANARGRLFRIDWYPGAIFEPNDPNRIVGEIYAVPDAIMRELDQFEGEEYERVRVTAQVDGGFEQAWAWNYLLPVDEAKRILSGNWLAADG